MSVKRSDVNTWKEHTESKVFSKPTRIEIVGEQIVIPLPNGVEQSASTCKTRVSAGRANKHVRLVDVPVAKQTFRDDIQDGCERRRLFFHRHGVVRVLVAQVFHVGRQVSKEDWTIDGRRRQRAGPSVVGPKEQEHSQTLLEPTSSAISMFAPSTVPRRRPPFKQNFMLDVPDASVPAVEMC